MDNTENQSTLDRIKQQIEEVAGIGCTVRNIDGSGVGLIRWWHATLYCGSSPCFSRRNWIYGHFFPRYLVVCRIWSWIEVVFSVFSVPICALSGVEAHILFLSVTFISINSSVAI